MPSVRHVIWNSKENHCGDHSKFSPAWLKFCSTTSTGTYIYVSSHMDCLTWSSLTPSRYIHKQEEEEEHGGRARLGFGHDEHGPPDRQKQLNAGFLNISSTR
jgi:hypothetical protein